MIVYVARHGETDWNVAGRYQGRRESSLTRLGRAQAHALAQALAACDLRRVCSSPLRRCIDTAEAVGQAHSLPVETDARLLEIAHGTWEGQLRATLERDDAETMRRWRERPDTVTFDGGESLADVAVRWREFAASLTGNNDAVVVTHDVLVRIALLTATGSPLAMLWEPRVVNGGYARFAVEGGAWSVLDECCDAHLGALLVDPNTQAL